MLIARHACALLPEMRKQYVPLDVIEEKCTGCSICFRIGCPSILKADEVDAKSGKPLALIDRSLCTGCEICAQVCPRDAIMFRDQQRAHDEGGGEACTLPTLGRS